MITLLSHLSHVEIATPDVEASVVFYEERLGLRVVGRDGGKAYLRSWGDYTHHSVVISEGPSRPSSRSAGAPPAPRRSKRPPVASRRPA